MGSWYNLAVRTLVASVFLVVASAGTAPAQLIRLNANARAALSTPPILGVVDDMVAAEGDTVAQTVRASDPDGDYLDFYGVYFFPFMRIDPISPGPSDASARIVLTPRPGQDHGRATVGVGVTDGVSSAEARFNITILEKHPGATWLTLRVEPQPLDIVWDSVRFDHLDGAFTASGTAQGGVTVTFDPPEPLTKNLSVELSCMPAQRPVCVSDRVNWWQLRFEPPLGGNLEPGLYEGATGSPDAQHGALEVRPFCGSTASCSVADSWFEVKEAVFDLAGAPVSFWATFERRCSDSPTVVSGEIRYSASPLVFVDPPSRVVAHAGAPLEVDLPIQGAAAEPRSVVSPDLPPGASLTMVTPDHAKLAWTPGLDQAGSYDLRLIAEASLAAPDTVPMTICVDVPGALAATMDVNRTTVITTNQGDPAYNASRNAPGVLHPAGSIPVANAIGLALAARVHGEIRVSLGDGYPVYAPGPLVNGMPAPFAPEFKNYIIRRSEPFGYDWDHWPVDQGAPVDGMGRPLILGDATIWSLYNDARMPVSPEPPRTAPPLGVEVRQTTWASESPLPIGDVVFQRFEIRNASADTLDEAYVGLHVDATTLEFNGGHVGTPSRTLAGCDTTLGLGYAYSEDYCGRPNAVGVAILRGPIASRGFGATDTLGLAAFQDSRSNFTDPAAGVYNQLRGLLPTGEVRHEFDDPSRPTTLYAYTGDPINGTGWLYPSNCYRSDFYASTGPFRLLPGERQEVIAAIVAATGSDPLDAVRRIRESAAAARSVTIPVSNRVPVARAGGPYQALAGEPIGFDASGSFDPDGDPLSFAWEFGDGAVGGGVSASHAYAEDGAYTVVLVASDYATSDSDTTIAEVGTLSVATGAEAYVLPSDAVIRLASARPYAWIVVEPRGGLFRPSDVMLSTVTLARADGSLAPIGLAEGKSRVNVDEDGDGIPEIAMAFSKAGLRSLLGDLRPGRTVVPVVVSGDVQQGGRFAIPLNVVVETGQPGLHATVAPNPFNPDATLTIHTSRAGRMRISLFNSAGQLVRTLLDAAALPAGYHDIAMDRRSGGGAALASGIYFYRVEAAEGSITGRFVILK